MPAANMPLETVASSDASPGKEMSLAGGGNEKRREPGFEIETAVRRNVAISHRRRRGHHKAARSDRGAEIIAAASREIHQRRSGAKLELVVFTTNSQVTEHQRRCKP